MSHKEPPRLCAGDKVAIISPSAGLAALFPWVYELGLKRLREVFELEPVEFPSARKSPQYLDKNPQARADDLNDAFADPSIKAIIATIGGNDQIRILPYLKPDLIISNPKIFLGYSDCTNLHLYLWNLGILSYYGAAIMTQFAMQGAMHDYTVSSIKSALFAEAIGKITPSHEWTDFDLDWSIEENLKKNRPMYLSDGWDWHNANDQMVKGQLWGGCLEVLDLHLSVKRYLPNPDKLTDAILYFETSEEMPTHGFVYRFIAALGELGLLKKFKAVLVGHPKSQFCGQEPTEGRQQFLTNQKEAIKKALVDYEADIPTVFNLNFGHTDPQLIIPNGGQVVIDCKEKSISFD